jgi:peptidoglycan/LPS O-acetylase OafA/YrhL
MFAVPALLAKVCTGFAFTLPTLADLRTNLLLYDFSINGATWTLLIEIIAIPFLILGWLLRRRLGIAGSFLFLAVCLIPSIAPKVVHHMMFGNFLFMFAIGSLVGDLGSKGLLNKVWMSPVLVLIVTTIVMLTAQILFGYGSTTSLRLEAIGAAVLITVITYGPRLPIHRILEAAPLRFLGRISYSFYLYHPMTFGLTMACLPAMASHSDTEAHPFLWSAVIAFLSIVAAIPLGWAGYVWVEKPMVRLGRKI